MSDGQCVRMQKKSSISTSGLQMQIPKAPLENNSVVFFFGFPTLMFNASSRIVAAAHPMCRDEGETETEQKLPPLYPPTACSCIRCFWHWGTSVHRPLFPVVLAKFAIQVACLYFLCVPPINPAFLARFVKWLRTPFFTRYFLSMLLSLYFFSKRVRSCFISETLSCTTTI